MESVFLILAEYANATADGKPNIMGVYDQIEAPEFPYTRPEIFLVSRMDARREEYGRPIKLNIKLVAPDTQQMFGEISLPEGSVPDGGNSQKVSITTFINLYGVTFPQPAIYEFHLFVDDELKQTTQLSVVQKASQ